MNNTELNTKLPVLDIFLEAIYLPIKHFRVLLKFGSPLIILSGLFFIYLSIFSGDNESNEYSSIIKILFNILTIASILMAVVGCHRTFLMSPEDVNNTRAIRWTGREMRFLGWWVAIGVITCIIAIPFAMVEMPIIRNLLEYEAKYKFYFYLILILVNLPIYYFIARWSLILPAAAIDKRNLSLFWAWDLSKDNGLRLLVLIGLIPLLAELIFNLFIPNSASLIFTYFINLLWFVISVMEIGLLSLSYAYLSKAKLTTKED